MGDMYMIDKWRNSSGYCLLADSVILSSDLHAHDPRRRRISDVEGHLRRLLVAADDVECERQMMTRFGLQDLALPQQLSGVGDLLDPCAGCPFRMDESPGLPKSLGARQRLPHQVGRTGDVNHV